MRGGFSSIIFCVFASEHARPSGDIFASSSRKFLAIEQSLPSERPSSRVYVNAGCGETPLRTALPRCPVRRRRSQPEEYGVDLENPQSRRGKGPAFPKSGKGSEWTGGG